MTNEKEVLKRIKLPLHSEAWRITDADGKMIAVVNVGHRDNMNAEIENKLAQMPCDSFNAQHGKE